jgi:hypothetical protein
MTRVQAQQLNTVRVDVDMSTSSPYGELLR